MNQTVLIALASLLFAAVSTAQTEVIAPTATWDYLHPVNGVDPAVADPDFATTWHSYTGYNGPAFTTNKPGPFSYGGIDYFTANAATLPGTLIGVGGTSTAPPTGLRYTAYFKKQFTTTEDYPNAIVRILADDGAVLYLDGVELAPRVNMSGATNGTGDGYFMLANGAVTETAFTPDFSIGAIPAGTHTIAVSLHNAATNSSDLGLYFQLFGSAPPRALLQTEFGGVNTTVTAVPDFTGWAPATETNFSMNGPAGTLHTIQSQPVDLSLIGEAYFSMQMYCYETSTGSNFEPEDEFSAKLLLTLDDDSQTEINLIPTDLDADANGVLSGDEFNPGFLPVTSAVVVGRELSTIIPANAKSVALQVNGLNDSPSENFRFGGARVSDSPFNTDTDEDGLSRSSELFAGTDPANAASSFRVDSLRYELDSASGSWRFYTVFPAVTGKRYSAERTTDGGASWTYYGGVTAGTTGLFTVYFDLTPAPPGQFITRLRVTP